MCSDGVRVDNSDVMGGRDLFAAGNRWVESKGSGAASFNGYKTTVPESCEKTEGYLNKVSCEEPGDPDVSMSERDIDSIQNIDQQFDQAVLKLNEELLEGERYRKQAIEQHDENKKIQTALENSEAKVESLNDKIQVEEKNNLQIVENCQSLRDHLAEEIKKHSAAQQREKQLSKQNQSLNEQVKKLSDENLELNHSLVGKTQTLAGEGESCSGSDRFNNQANSMMFESESEVSTSLNLELYRVLLSDPEFIKDDRSNVLEMDCSETDAAVLENNNLKKELAVVKQQLEVEQNVLEAAYQKTKELTDERSQLQYRNKMLNDELGEKVQKNIRVISERDCAHKQVQGLCEQVSFLQVEMSQRDNELKRLKDTEQELDHARQEIQSHQGDRLQSAETAEEKQELEQMMRVVADLWAVIEESTDDKAKQKCQAIVEPFTTKSGGVV
ncbi:hypothetical protein [Endozoicomonas sp.]|uniref:hypothetical protein n=1 Tax=Endozoicomonas sp. TaxID=1892382 RepID=UPI00288821EE|nr:hypothetical protein [Endozoicomonas sp.]